MRRMASVIVPILIAALATSPAAGKKSPQLKLYLHGYERAGELEVPDMPGWTKDKLWKPMDTSLPADDLPKSMFVTNAVQTPNPSCSGNPYYPVWKADLTGTVQDVKVTLHTVATPGSTIAVSLFRDLETADCYSQDVSGSIVPSEYKPPLAAQKIDVPQGAGQVTVDFKGVKFEVFRNLIVQVQIYDQFNNPGDQVRIFYDSPDYPSLATLKCKPVSCGIKN